MLNAQEYYMIDTLYFGSKVKEVRLVNSYISQNLEIQSARFVFNDKGLHVTSYWENCHPYQLKTVYAYSGNTLSSIKRLKHISPDNETLSTRYSKEMHIAFRKYGNNKEKANKALDSLKAKYDALYQYEKPEHINWEKDAFVESKYDLKYDSYNRLSKVYSYQQSHQKGMYLDGMVYYRYNQQGQIINEKRKWIKNKNRFSFQAFKPSSADVEDSIKSLDGALMEKRFKYTNDSTIIEYRLNNQTTGYEYQVLNRRTNQKEYRLINSNKDTLSVYQETFNKANQLTKRTRVFDSGYDGFGYAQDLAHGNEMVYHYDSPGRLIKIVTLQNGEPVYVDKYEIDERNNK
jgi:hypothetical protein